MSTTNQFTIDTGSTIYVGSFLITQSAVQVNLPISVLVDGTGAEKGLPTNPYYVIPSGGSTTITGSVSILSAPASTTNSVITVLPSITGSVTVLSMPASTTNSVITVLPSITGSVTVLNASTTNSVITVLPAITGSVSIVNPITGSVSLVVMPSYSSATINVGTAGTSIIVPSIATNAIYLTSILVSNGNTAGTIYFGYGTGATAPTTTAINIQTLYFAANGGMTYPIPQQTPIKIPASNNFICTVNSAGSLSILVNYYVAP